MFGLKVSAFGMVVTAGLFAAGGASAADPPAKKAAAPAKPAAASVDEVAVMETSRGRMVIEFWEKDAPKTVANFKKLAKQGYFDGTGFHRIIKGFMIQGGDPKSKNPKAPDLGTGDPGYKIPDEFNARKHVKGVLSMANSGTPNSAGSQFFIMHGTAGSLDGKYTAFGRLMQGMDVLDAIANSPVGPNAMMNGERSKPLEWTTVKSVKIVPRASLSASAAKAAAPGAIKAGASTGAGVTAKPAENKAAAQEKAAAAKAAGQAKADEAKAAVQPAAEQAKDAAKDAAKAAPDSAKADPHEGHNH